MSETNLSNNIVFNTAIYPNIHISSKDIINNRGLFIVNPSIDINLIEESHITSSTFINRARDFILSPGLINISGTVEILIAGKFVKFYTFKNINQTELTGILGRSFLNIDPKEFHF